jgi:hypothetical protein
VIEMFREKIMEMLRDTPLWKFGSWFMYTIPFAKYIVAVTTLFLAVLVTGYYFFINLAYDPMWYGQAWFTDEMFPFRFGATFAEFMWIPFEREGFKWMTSIWMLPWILVIVGSFIAMKITKIRILRTNIVWTSICVYLNWLALWMQSLTRSGYGFQVDLSWIQPHWQRPYVIFTYDVMTQQFPGIDNITHYLTATSSIAWFCIFNIPFKFIFVILATFLQIVIWEANQYNNLTINAFTDMMYGSMGALTAFFGYNALMRPKEFVRNVRDVGDVKKRVKAKLRTMLSEDHYICSECNTDWPKFLGKECPTCDKDE